MYATTRRYEGVTDPAEASRRVNEGFVKLMRQLPGFVSYYWADAGNGVVITTTVYQDKKSADQSNEKAADWAKQNLQGIVRQPPQVTSGEVMASA